MTAPAIAAHPYADAFPMLAEFDLVELAESIRTNGLRQPITVTPDGLILDGRNRAAACAMLGVEPDMVVYDRDDLAEYVIDCNVTRRNMTTGARAMATAIVLVADGRRDGGRWKRGSVQVGNDESVITGGWAQRLKEAGVVLDYLPDLAADVVNGVTSLNAAFEKADAIRTSAERDKIMERERKRREKEEAAADAERHAQIVADLTQAKSKYLPLIESGDLTPAAAWAAHLEDTRKERQARDEIERGIRDTNIRLAECVRSLAVHAPGDLLVSEFLPHHNRVVGEGMRLNRERVTDAIAVLTAVLKEIDR
jgi:hypothetical protein